MLNRVDVYFQTSDTTIFILSFVLSGNACVTYSSFPQQLSNHSRSNVKYTSISRNNRDNLNRRLLSYYFLSYFHNILLSHFLLFIILLLFTVYYLLLIYYYYYYFMWFQNANRYKYWWMCQNNIAVSVCYYLNKIL